VTVTRRTVDFRAKSSGQQERGGPRRMRRRGAAIVEMAIVGPLALLLIIGLIVVVLGVFRLQQVSRLAHEGSRWASIHGTDWERYTRSRPVTENDVFREAMQPLAQGLNPNRLQHHVEWNEARTLVTVSVTYRWLPEVFFSASVITATSVHPVSF
jgi:Flp pilus assembly protein TadG